MGKLWVENKKHTDPADNFADQNFDTGIELLVGHAISEVERSLICATVARCDGNKTRAAKVLGLSVRGLRYRTNGTAGRG